MGSCPGLLPHPRSSSVDALMQALQPFEGVMDEQLACLPPDLNDG